MPVGRPTDDGDIVKGSRHGSHKGGLGAVGPWDCPACGVKNEGRRPELGCVHCGSGDPSKSKAGSPMGPPKGAPAQRPVSQAVQQRAPDVGAAPSRLSSVPAAERKVYRLIEYLITDPQAGADVLRRALVGTLTLRWGTITGAIVDEVSMLQEDRLRMARMQPGVWLGNSTLGGRTPKGWTVTPLDPQMPLQHPGRPADVNEFHRAAAAREAAAMDVPETGPIYSQEILGLAQLLLDLFARAMPGREYAAIHTLSMGLAGVAEELQGNMEPDKFLRSQECVQLANALIHLLPEDWEQQTSEADEPPPAAPGGSIAP